MYCISWGWSVLPGFEQRLFCNSRFVWTSLNLMYIVCIHSLTHTYRHTQTFREYQPNTHTGYHPHKCKASTYYAVADMHGYKIEGKGVFLSDRILT